MSNKIEDQIPDFAKLMLNEMAEQRNSALNDLVAAKAAIAASDKAIGEMARRIEELTAKVAALEAEKNSNVAD